MLGNTLNNKLRFSDLQWYFWAMYSLNFILSKAKGYSLHIQCLVASFAQVCNL